MSKAGWAAAALLAFSPAFAFRARCQPAGPEFPVSVSSSSQEGSPAVGPSGEFVVVFRGATGHVAGRRFTPAGQPASADVPLSDGADTELLPSAAVLPDGGVFVAWSNSPNGDYEIHGRRFDGALAPRTGDFRVNTTTTSSQFGQAMAAAPSGAMLVVWYAPDGDGQGIFGQRFTPAGAPAGAEFRVNTTTLAGQYDPWVAADGQGAFVVVWHSGETGSRDILAQRFSVSSSPAGGEITVNSFTLGEQTTPFVAADGTGSFVVVWTSSSSPGENGSGVYGQRFAPSGSKRGAEFHVNAFTTGEQWASGVVSDSQGRFGVVFVDGFSTKVRLQEFAADGSPKLEHVLSDINGPIDTAARTGGNRSGAGMASWQTSNGIYGRRFSLSPDPLGAEFRVNTVTGGDQIDPAIAAAANGSFVVAWATPSYAINTIVAQRFAAGGAPLGGQMPVASLGVASSFPSVGSDSSGSFVIVWQSDPIFSSAYVSTRRFDAAGNALGTETFTPGATPDVDRNAAGDYVVVWVYTESGAGGNEIGAQRYAASGAPRGASFRVNLVTTGVQGTPEVAIDAAGNFVVVWTSPEDGSGTAVVARRFASSGTPLGQPFLVNGFTNDDQDEPDVDMAADGEFVVTWKSADGGASGVSAQRYAASGAPLGNAFFANAETAGNQRRGRVAVHPSGGFVVSFLLAGDYTTVKRARLFGRNGTPLGPEFPAGSGNQAISRPAPAFAGADLVLAWGEYVGQVDIYAQRYRVRLCAAGDANADGMVNVSDILFLINHLFAGGPPPTSCGDVNGDSIVSVSDVLYLINALFAGGPIPI